MSCATAPSPARTAGRRMPATARSRWPSRSPHCLPPPTCWTPAASQTTAIYLRETADGWNDQVERWTYVTGTAICAEAQASRAIMSASRRPTAPSAGSPKDGFVPIKNRPPGDTDRPAEAIVSPDALALVRFGLRAADDPRIVDTVKVIDARLRCDLPQGPLWYRYNGDGYGEHEDGAPFDGTGQGRPWPLLTGERAHYELAAGRKDKAAEPAQDAGGLGRRRRPAAGTGLGRRRHAGARIAAAAARRAAPCRWSGRTAEHIKLLRSLRDGAVFDMPPQGVKRYIEDKTVSPFRTWRFNNKIRSLPAGKTLRVELAGAGDRSLEQRTTGRPPSDAQTEENAFGIHLADLPTASLAQGKHAGLHFFLARNRRLGECRLLRHIRRSGQPVNPSSINQQISRKQGRNHADRNDGTGPDGRQHGPPPDARRPRMRRLRHQPRQRRRLGDRRRAGRGIADGIRRQARQAALCLADAAGGDHRQDRRPGRGPDGARRHHHRRRQFLLSRRRRPGRETGGQGHPLCRCRHQRRRLGPGARLLPDDRRPRRGGAASRPDLRDAGARRRCRRTRPRQGRPAPRPSAICIAARAAPATSSRWCTTASNTASWPPMPKA